VAKLGFVRQRTVKRAVVNRLSYAIGHLEGVRKMVQDDAYCMDILQQTQAVSSILKSVNTLLLSDHLKHCVYDAMVSPSRRRMNKAVRELVEIYGRRT
jgi:DNA-binding FrmR family transcriptional regulator